MQVGIEQVAGVEKSAKRAGWREIVAEYQSPRRAASVRGVVTTLAMFLGAWVAMAVLGWPWALLIIPVAAGFMVRTFILMHDCTHGSLFRSHRANDIVGFVTGVLTATPYAQWRREHAIHHAHAGSLEGRGVGDIKTLTVREYLALGRWPRLRYRLYRNPLVMLGFGPLFMLTWQRWPSQHSGRRERVGVHLTNLALAGLFLGGSLLLGPLAFFSLYVPTAMLAGAAGIWLFYVQHQYEDTYWAHKGEWDYATAAVSGSSYYRLPRLLDWLTGSIGFHHVHHLSPRIPHYNLRRCHQSNELFECAHVLTLRESVGTLRLKLWDEDRQRLIGWREFRRTAEAAG